MRIVMWVGNEPNQRALANKIHNRFPLAGIVTETKTRKRKITLNKIVEKGFEKLFLGIIAKAWFGMLAYYREKFTEYPSTKLLDVENINSEKVFDFTRSLIPDLIIVSGTRLIKGKLLSISPTIGILNLHTGLSPYVKGGPNCSNWCISTGQFHLIGNTMMWIDEGIDSGNIMGTEFTQFTGNESLKEIHIKVMEHAHDLCLRSVESIHSGITNNIPQVEIGNGVTYYNKQWRLKEKVKLVRNLKKFKKEFRLNHIDSRRKNIKTIPI